MGKYIVTGGAGFIGSHICESLVKLGHDIVVVDNLSTGFLEYISGLSRQLKPKQSFTFLKLDISDWTELSKNFAYFKDVTGVFHLAACARIQPSIFNPILTHDTNVTGTLNILEMMRMCNIENIVYSASSSYYGKKAKIPSLESDPCDCQTPYSVSKYMGELYCDTWAKLHGVKSARLRYFNVYGPRSPTEGIYAPVIGLFFKQALVGEPITVIGDGEQRRDFTYVKDVVSANILAMEKLSKEKNGTSYVFNVGTSKNYSMNELAKLVADSVQKKFGTNYPQIIHVPERIGEAKLSLAENTEIEKVLGWVPQCNLPSMIEELADYYANLF